MASFSESASAADDLDHPYGFNLASDESVV